MGGRNCKWGGGGNIRATVKECKCTSLEGKSVTECMPAFVDITS